MNEGVRFMNGDEKGSGPKAGGVDVRVFPLYLRRRVRAVVRSEWSAFAERHPELASVVDEDLLVRGATENLADDAEFVDAMRQADAAGLVMEVTTNLLRRHVARWLTRLTA